MMSDPETKADYLKNSTFITVQGKSGEAMTVQQSVMYIYGDQFKSKLLATVLIEV